jgi:AcrR family transcriptional regulator
MAGTVARRREARTAQIVASAWALAREHGVAGVSLHALAREVGIRQPSLYEYFDSKNALYDAMFADGNRQLLDCLDATRFSPEPRKALKQCLAVFLAFACEDPARHQLMFQRPIPGFAPSPDSYALAEEALGRVVTLMRAAGVTGQGDIDCITAMTGGLMDAQIANDPGGTRWSRHLDHLTDLLVDDAIARGGTHDT